MKIVLSSDLLLPVLIVLGSIVLGLAVHFLKRPSPSRQDIVAPQPRPNRKQRKVAATPPPSQDGETEVSRDALVGWHQEYEEVVLDFIEDHEDQLLADPPDTDLQAAENEALLEATTNHPSSIMAAELSALHVAATGTLRCLAREEPDAAADHHQTYQRYRREWMDRLWQFPQDSGRVRELRNSSAPLPAALAVPQAAFDLLHPEGELDELDEPEIEDPMAEELHATEGDNDDGPLPPVNPLEPDEEPTGRHAAINLDAVQEQTPEPAGRHVATDQRVTEESTSRLNRLFRR